MGFFKKKEEKKKFDYSDDTKELFAERDAFYARMRQELESKLDNFVLYSIISFALSLSRNFND